MQYIHIYIYISRKTFKFSSLHLLTQNFFLLTEHQKRSMVLIFLKIK